MAQSKIGFNLASTLPNWPSGWLRPGKLRFWHYGVFLVLLLGLYFLYYNGRLSGAIYQPQAWRQADSYSMTLAYYQEDHGLLEPRVHNALHEKRDEYVPASEHGRGAGECPLLYYVLAQLFELNGGPSYLLYRLFWLLLFTGGMMALFWLSFRFTGQLHAAYFTPLLLFTAPTLIHHAPNFIANPPALAFMWMGMAALIHYFDQNKRKANEKSSEAKDSDLSWVWFLLSLVLFIVAGLTKVTELMMLVAIVALVTINEVWCRLFRREAPFPLFRAPHPWLFLLGILLIGSVVAGWYLYAIAYNDAYATSYFSTEIKAIWEMDSQKIAHIWHKLITFWYKFYLYPPFWYLLPALLLFSLAFARRLSNEITGLLVLFFLGCIAYSSMWYLGYLWDEYYVIEEYPLVVILLWAGFYLLEQTWPTFNRHWLASALILIFLVGGVHYGANSFGKREILWGINDNLKGQGMQDFLDRNGVSQDKLVFCYPDPSPNYFLATVRRFGFSSYNFKPERQENLSQALQRYQVDYILIGDTAKANQHRQWFRGSLQDTLGHYKDVYLFRAPE